MKFVYYGFGAFIGFGCGTAINLIFYWLEKSGNTLLTDLVQDYGLFGHFFAELVNMLPFFGVALGILLVRLQLPGEFGNDKE